MVKHNISISDLDAMNINELVTLAKDIYGHKTVSHLLEQYLKGLVMNRLQDYRPDFERRISTIIPGRIIAYQIDGRWDSGIVRTNRPECRRIELKMWSGEYIEIDYDDVEWIRNQKFPYKIRRKLEICAEDETARF